MAKGVFDARSGSGCEDEIVERYHFPNRYLSIAQQFVGDWIVYRETLRGSGRSGYIATARVVRIAPDPRRSDDAATGLWGCCPRPDVSIDASAGLEVS
jgi:putative restriction endonuclease